MCRWLLCGVAALLFSQPMVAAYGQSASSAPSYTRNPASAAPRATAGPADLQPAYQRSAIQQVSYQDYQQQMPGGELPAPTVTPSQPATLPPRAAPLPAPSMCTEC